jgi:hypothetical protein
MYTVRNTELSKCSRFICMKLCSMHLRITYDKKPSLILVHGSYMKNTVLHGFLTEMLLALHAFYVRNLCNAVRVQNLHPRMHVIVHIQNMRVHCT